MSLLTQSAWFTVRVVTATASGRDIARASVAQVVRFFFARTGNCAPSAPLPEKVDRFQIAPRCQCLRPRFSVFSAFSAAFSSRRLQNRAVFRVFSSAADHRRSLPRLLGQPRDVGLAQSLHSTLLADGHGRPFPRGPTRPHYRPRRRMTTLTCPLVTACAMSPCLSRLHPPRRCARVTMLLAPAYPLPVCFLFSFSANFLFCSPVTAHEPKKSCQASHRFTWDQVVRTHFKHPRTSETDLLAFDEIHSDNLVVGKGRQDWEGKTKDGK